MIRTTVFQDVPLFFLRSLTENALQSLSVNSFHDKSVLIILKKNESRITNLGLRDLLTDHSWRGQNRPPRYEWSQDNQASKRAHFAPFRKENCSMC